ncbi:MAG: hypothetical protein JWN80_179 [Microbacteriaceae bacterium]|jgi:hypothetical protein|nr:hypothetical protein [Microbacteriaceae bacterium]
MGMLDDYNRIKAATAGKPRVGLAQSLSNAADAAEAVKGYQEAAAAAQAASGGYGANPFDNLAAMNSATPGSGVVKALVDTGQKYETTTIYDVTLEVTVDGQPPYEVVHRQMIAAAALGNWQVGKVIGLRVDSKDKTQVMLG